MPSITLLKSLREKPYGEADKEEQEAYFLYASKLLPAFVPAWKRNGIQMEKYMSEIITPSDEAFTMWLIQLRHDQWNVKAKEKHPASNKRGKQKGQHCSTTEMRSYKILHQHIVSVRKFGHNKEWELELQKQFLAGNKKQSFQNGKISTDSNDEYDEDSVDDNSDNDIPMDDSDND
jgi:hypothetical protein